jgi:hypothetical protein
MPITVPNEGPITNFKDMLKPTYKIRLKIFTHNGERFRDDRAKLKQINGIPYIKLWSNKNVYPAPDLKYSQIDSVGHEYYLQYMPNDDELHPIDIRRLKLRGSIEAIQEKFKVGIRTEDDVRAVYDAIEELKIFSEKTIWFEPTMNQSTKIAYANLIEDINDYFTRTWWERYGPIIVALGAFLLVGIVVYFYYDYTNKATVEWGKQLPSFINECAKFYRDLPKA